MIEKICGIYKITSPSGKVYIGQSVNIYQRWNREYKKVRCKSQILLYNSLIKYGVESHKFEIIHVCSEPKLNELEAHYIDLFNSFNNKNGLNLRGGGGVIKVSSESRKKMSDAKIGMYIGDKNPNFGKKHSEETKRKIGLANKGKFSGEKCYFYGKNFSGENNPNYGKKLSEEAKIKISIANSGKVPSEETRKKISIANKGKVINEAYRKKISDTKKGVKVSDKARNNMIIAQKKRRENNKLKKNLQT